MLTSNGSHRPLLIVFQSLLFLLGFGAVLSETSGPGMVTSPSGDSYTYDVSMSMSKLMTSMEYNIEAKYFKNGECDLTDKVLVRLWGKDEKNDWTSISIDFNGEKCQSASVCPNDTTNYAIYDCTNLNDGLTSNGECEVIYDKKENEPIKFLFVRNLDTAAYGIPVSGTTDCAQKCAYQNGDVHMESFDGLQWDCQAKGVLQTFKGQKSDGTYFQVQTLTDSVLQNPTAAISVTRALLINTGEGDSVTLSVPADAQNGCPMTFKSGTVRINTFDVPNAFVHEDVTFTTDTNYAKADFTTEGITVEIFVSTVAYFGCYLSFTVCTTNCRWTEPSKTQAKNVPYVVTGLMGGRSDGEQQNDWIKPDGSIQAVDNTQLVGQAAYDFCSTNYCLNAKESLFEFPVENNSFDYYNKCNAAYDGSLEKEINTIEQDSETDTSKKEVVDLCRRLYADDETLLHNCYLEGVVGGVDQVASWSQTERKSHNQTVPAEVTTIIESYSAGGAKTQATTKPGGDEEKDQATTKPGGDEEKDEATKKPGGDEEKDQATKKPGGDEEKDEATKKPGGDEEKDQATTKPKSTSGVNGDPHFKTWAGDKYDYHGICDLVLLSNLNFNRGLGMEIHIRSKRTMRWSYISTAVIRIGSETFEVAGTLDGNSHWLNMAEVNDDAWGKTLNDDSGVRINGYQIKHQKLYTNQRKYVIDLENKEKIQIKTWKDMVRVDIINNPLLKAEKSIYSDSLGLMGSYPDGIMYGRDGKTIISELNDFGQEWQVLSSEPKIFHIEKDGPQHPDMCESPSKEAMRRGLAESMLTRADAEIACSRSGIIADEFDLCVFDVMATGSTDVAAGAH